MRHYCGTGGPALEQYTSLVIITPAVDTAWVEALVPLLRRGVIPTVLLLDPVSFARPEPFEPFDEALRLRSGQAQDRPFGGVYPEQCRRAQDRPCSGQTKSKGWDWRPFDKLRAPLERDAGAKSRVRVVPSLSRGRRVAR